MPEIHDEELGRRLFITNQEKAVEEALQKVQRSLGHSWNIFSTSDVTALKNIMGELWVTVGREEWGTYTFARLVRDDIDNLIVLSKKAGKSRKIEPADLVKAKEILEKTR